MKVFSCILEHYQPRADKSLKIVFGTAEATPADVSFLQQHLKRIMAVGINEDTLSPNQVDLIDSVKIDYTDAGKSPATRLRGVFYRLWEMDNEGFDSFDLFYVAKMEKLIGHFKDKLP
jgi:hypothetical protein